VHEQRLLACAAISGAARFAAPPHSFIGVQVSLIVAEPQ
jgi:hypothetical protein